MDVNDFLYGAGATERTRASNAAQDAWLHRSEPAFIKALADYKAASGGGTPGWAASIDAASYAAQFGLNPSQPTPPPSQPVPADLHSIAARPNVSEGPTLSDILKAVQDLAGQVSKIIKATGL